VSFSSLVLELVVLVRAPCQAARITSEPRAWESFTRNGRMSRSFK
jgi:hypothetical protein